jgi:hypothetical protein
MGRNIIIRLALIVVVSLFMIPGCEQRPKSIEDLSHKIRTVSYLVENNVKIVRIELDGVFGRDEALYFFRAYQEMYKILRKIAVYFPDEQQLVYFVLKVPLQNLYDGKARNAAVLEVPFSMSTVRKVKYFNSNRWDLLNSSGTIKYDHPVGRNIIQSFCAETAYQKHAAKFCLAAQ